MGPKLLPIHNWSFSIHPLWKSNFLSFDPDYGDAYRALGWAQFNNATAGWTEFFLRPCNNRHKILGKKAVNLEYAEAAAKMVLMLQPYFDIDSYGMVKDPEVGPQ